jgi:hypothetical protein
MPQLIPAFVASLGPAFATAGTAASLTTLGTIVSAGLGIGLSVGLNFLAQELIGGGPSPQKVKTTIRSPVTSRRRHYGLDCGGGNIVSIRQERGNLHQVIVFADGPFNEFQGWLLDERDVTLGPHDDIPTSPGWPQEEPYNAERVRIDARLGTVSQTAFDLMLARFPTIWTPQHQLKGIACAHLYQKGVDDEDFIEVYPNRVAQLKWIAETSLVYDPRTDTTGYTANLPLCLRDYITHPKGARIPAEFVDDDLFSIAADVGDETFLNKAGETVRLYHGALAYSFDEQPKSVIDRFLLATDGRTFLTPEGKIGYQPGKWIEPTVHITSDHIRGFNFKQGSGPLREKNEIILKYTNPKARFTEATCDPWRNEASISAYGKRSLALDAFEIREHIRARMIAKILEARSSPAWLGTVRTDLFGMQAWDQRWIYLSIPVLGIDTMSFEVLAIEEDENTDTVIMVVASFDGNTVYAFNPATEEGTEPTVPEDVEDTTIDPPSSVNATLIEQTVSGTPAPGGGTPYRGVLAPATAGLSSSASVFCIYPALDFTGTWETLQLFANAAGGQTLTPLVMSVSGNTHTVLRTGPTITVGANLRSYAVGVSVNEGEFVGFDAGGSGWSLAASVAAGTSVTPFRNGTLSGGAFTDSTTTDNIDIQFKANFSAFGNSDISIYIARISMPPPTDRDDLGPEFQFKLSTDGASDWMPVGAAQQTWFATTSALERGKTYNTRGRYKTRGGRPSVWVDGPDLTVPA